VSKIRTWLDGIGLAQYTDAFEANDIDIDLLHQVDDQVLKDIGVSSAGHRLRIRSAIAKLALAVDGSNKSDLPAKAPIEDTPRGHPRDTQHVQASGERRHVTVMFCDLVDSTGISAKLDAEEWRDLVGAYLDAASAAVTEMGGKVAKKLGDGLMALFGYPVARENDAERAGGRSGSRYGAPPAQSRAATTHASHPSRLLTSRRLSRCHRGGRGCWPVPWRPDLRR
jgi:class 3 adenylate cyclase